MGFDENIEMVRLAFYQVLISSGPFLGAALAIGLIIGIIQAATSIQEMTLSFVPKIVLVILAMGMMANFFLVSLTDYFQFISIVISFFYFGYISDTEITINEIENLFIIVVIEAIIGIALGLSLSIWFSAATLAGEKMASSTGLGFSMMVDPQTGGQTPVVSMILDLFLITVFLSLNGHLIAIDFLIRSFDIYNISTDLPPIALVSLGIEAAGAMFYTGGLIMLPVVGALLLTNIAIGVITRSSPQLNMFSFAFPVTLLLAFFVLYLSSRTIGNAFADLTKNSLESIDVLFLGK